MALLSPHGCISLFLYAVAALCFCLGYSFVFLDYLLLLASILCVAHLPSVKQG